MLFEEIKPNMLERIEEPERPLEHVLEELMDGDIIVFQVTSLLNFVLFPWLALSGYYLQVRPGARGLEGRNWKMLH